MIVNETQCDRCGEPAQSAVHVSYRRSHLRRSWFERTFRARGPTERAVDLCESCQASFIEWIQSKGRCK